jgi:hypothetical protein
LDPAKANALAYLTSSLVAKKKFYNVATCGQCFKTFYGRKLRLFLLS